MADTVVFAEQTLTLSRSGNVAYGDIDPAPFILTEGEPYRVVLDGVEHEISAVGDSPSILYTIQDENGNPDSGSFQIMYSPQELSGFNGGVVSIAVWGESDTHTIAIYQKEKAITYTVPSAALKAVADAVRAKTGSKNAIVFPSGMVEAIGKISAENVTYPLADKPETMGQRACLARAAQMRDIQWTLKGDLTMTGGSVYPTGKVVTGLPYSSVRKTDRFIGYNISLYTFMTAVHNPRSLLYTTTADENTADNGNIANLYYGVNCSVFGSFAHDWNYHSATNTIPELPYIEEIDPSEMKLCDLPVASLDHGGGTGHCTMVTAIERNADGSIANLEISETTLPITRATKMTYAAFLSTYINGAGYKVYRDNRLYDTSYKPSPFVRVFDEESVEDIVYSNLCTNRGDKVSITTDEDIKLNVLIDSGYEAIVLMKDGVLYGTYQATNGDIMDGDLPLSGLPVGLYTAALFDSDGVALDNAYTSFEVCSVSARQNGNRYYFQGDGIPVRVVFKDSGGYTIAVFDVTDEDIARGYKDIPYATSKTIAQICVPFKTRYGFVVARCAYDPAGTSGGEGEVDPPDTPSENLPTEYQQVEYVATDGNQYIDTGVIPSDYTDGIHYELDFYAEPTGSNNTDYLFGCLSGEGRSGNFGAHFTQGNIRLIAGSTSSNSTYNWYNIRNRCIVRVFATSENPSSRSLSFERDGTVTTPSPLTSTYESKPMPSESIYLFNCRGISRISCAVTCWGFNMTAADGTPIRNFVPCYRKSDNVIGLYDMVEGKFYTNAGTGAFTKGADSGGSSASLISFTIDGTSYQAEEGMTWEVWCDSGYNTGGYCVTSSGISDSPFGSSYVKLNGTVVSLSDTIVNGSAYTFG